MVTARLKSAAVVLGSLLCLPLSLFVVILTFIIGLPFRPRRSKPSGLSILITGGRSSSSLVLARQFNAAGHRVVLTEEEDHKHCGARFSSAVDAFYSLPNPLRSQQQYNTKLLDIVRKERIDILVPCCDNSSAISVGMAKTDLLKHCQVLQFDEETSNKLRRHDSFSFLADRIGIDVLFTNRVTSSKEVLAFNFQDTSLRNRKFALKSLRAGSDLLTSKGTRLQAIDARKLTPDDLGLLDVSEENPYMLQEQVEGQQYQCHALTWKGVVRSFVCNFATAHNFQHIMPLKHEMKISSFLDFQIDIAALERAKVAQRMQDIITQFASHYKLTGPLTMNFIATNHHNGTKLSEVSVLPLSAEPFTNASISCFYGSRGLEMAFTRLAHNSNDAYHWPIFPDACSRPTYFFYHELFSFIFGFRWFTKTPRSWRQLVRRIWREREIYWDLYDPLPFLMVYHWQWCFIILREGLWRGRRWKALDVASGEFVWYG